ncbi:MAG: InlB B-repeat-containing protein, partial [Treponema sp.]|nr:InlB B-repeat-containing protein [Treponema sp.]
MNKSYFFRRLSRGLLAALALACMFTGCPTNTEDTDEPTTYTVTFNTNGGTAVDAVQVEEGKTLTKPGAPAKTGYTFSAWYRDAGLT